jgi:hypothetical protein
MPEKSSAQSESTNMSIVREMHVSIVEIAGPVGWHDTRESWLATAARTSGVTYRAAKGFFYREYTNPNAADVQRVRDARTRLHATNEVLRNAAILEGASDALEKIDAEFHRTEIGRLRDVAGALRRQAIGTAVKP